MLIIKDFLDKTTISDIVQKNRKDLENKEIDDIKNPVKVYI